ncbi:MAG: hypothetical protein IH845_03160 [Nanoarchaeota archaeon]|nr:hypothetical protein [Nanoarchaeota archaeon]
MVNKFSINEKKFFLLGLISALGLAIFANLFVTSFFEMLRVTKYYSVSNIRGILILSSIAMAFLFNWFYKKIE